MKFEEIRKQNLNKISDEPVAIKVQDVSKTFKIPHEKHSTLKQAALNVFKSKSFEKYEALKKVGFEIKKGEFFGIIGKNGSGKSTLLKILAGIYQADSGEVALSGKISPFLELGVGFNPELTARENLFLGGALLGLTRNEISEKFDEIIKFAELQEFVDMKFKNFSSGMQVRLAFSLAIHAHADILLMDEVLAVGDSNFQAKCLEIFNDYKEQGKTVVLVSHDTGIIQRYCDRVVLLKNGKIKKIGQAQDVIFEYIKENIEDEEVAEAEVSSENQKNKKIEKKKNAEIKNIQILDENGKKKDMLFSGDSLSIKVDFKNNGKGPINVGIGVYKDDGAYVLGYNTQMDNFSLKRGSAVLNLKDIPLLKGNYFINVILFGKIEEKFYDFKPRAQKFRALPTKGAEDYRGILNIEHNWS